jgi:RNA polymerase-interacting CarD/CdnL/TRCF family regulator
MTVYEIGDTVVHWTYGSGTITAIENKGLPGKPCFYYEIDGHDQTLWVLIEENGESSLHLPTSRADFMLLIEILKSQGANMSNNPYIRYGQLAQRMQKASPHDIFLVVRDLNYRSRWEKLSRSDALVLTLAKSYLLDEWERSLGTPRDLARREMESSLKVWN